jgi:tetratricopeptide (TPR) repeat protein
MNQRVNSLWVILVWVFLFFILMLSIKGNATAQGTKPNQEKLSLAGGICVSRAQALFQAGDVRGALDLVEAFKKKSNSAHYYIHFLLGNYYLSLDQTQEAITYYQASVELNLKFSAGWLNLAKSLYESSLFAKAALAFEQGYATSPTPDPIHLYYAAICHFQADAPQEALVLFERLILAHPDKICLVWKESLVNILFSLEHYLQALPILEELAANTKGEKKKQWQEILLSQYLNLNMKKKALAHAGFLTRADPLEPRWWKILCQIHLDGNRYKQGLSALIIYGYLTPMTPSERMLAGDLYVFLGVPVQGAIFHQATLEREQIKTLETHLLQQENTDVDIPFKN